MKSLSSSKLAVVYAVFAAIFPLTFTIANGKASFLIDSLINVVWCSFDVESICFSFDLFP